MTQHNARAETRVDKLSGKAADATTTSLKTTSSKMTTKTASTTVDEQSKIDSPVAQQTSADAITSDTTAGMPIEPAAATAAPPVEMTTPTTTTTPTTATTAETATADIPTTPTAAAPETVAATASAIKERKRRIIVDDGDESPTFNPLARGAKKGRGRGRGARGRAQFLKNRRIQLTESPEKSRDDSVFTTPDGIVSIFFSSHSSFSSLFYFSLIFSWR